MMICPKCRKRYNEDISVCPVCGFDLVGIIKDNSKGSSNHETEQMVTRINDGFVPVVYKTKSQEVHKPKKKNYLAIILLIVGILLLAGSLYFFVISKQDFLYFADNMFNYIEIYYIK